VRRSAQARAHEPQQVKDKKLRRGKKDREVRGYMPDQKEERWEELPYKGNQKLVIRCSVKNGTASLGGGKNLG